jgi:hypothetical protein
VTTFALASSPLVGPTALAPLANVLIDRRI